MRKMSKEEVLDESLNERYIRFLNSRKGKGKKYVEEIVSFLNERYQTDPGGWVRAYELQKKNLCVDQTLFRLLSDLTSLLVIERRGEKSSNPHGNGQHPVSYRLTPYAMFRVRTDAGRKKELSRLVEENRKLGLTVTSFRRVLARHNLLGLLPEIERDLKEVEDFIPHSPEEMHRIKLSSLSEPSTTDRTQ